MVCQNVSLNWSEEHLMVSTVYVMFCLLVRNGHNLSINKCVAYDLCRENELNFI